MQEFLARVKSSDLERTRNDRFLDHAAGGDRRADRFVKLMLSMAMRHIPRIASEVSRIGGDGLGAPCVPDPGEFVDFGP